MIGRRVTPRSFVLDVLRVMGEGVSTSWLAQIGALFGISVRALRVAIERLSAQGLVESDEQGWCRLAPSAAALARHVERWRLGEARVRRWNGEWLAVALPEPSDGAQQRRSQRALALLGFREALPSVHVRPDNLALSRAELQATLELLGLEHGLESFLVRELSMALKHELARELWRIDSLVEGYRQAARSLEQSAERIPHLSLERALIESFERGGQAIHLLAVDPLLPAEILPSGDRRRLTERMLSYDVLGRRLWARELGSVRIHPVTAPSAPDRVA